MLFNRRLLRPVFRRIYGLGRVKGPSLFFQRFLFPGFDPFSAKVVVTPSIRIVPTFYTPVNSLGIAEVDANGNILRYPGIPADQCQELWDNEYLPFNFYFSSPGTYTIQVVSCQDGSMIASSATTISLVPPPPPPQQYQLQMMDESANVLNQFAIEIPGAAVNPVETLPAQTVKLGEMFQISLSGVSGPLVTNDSQSHVMEAAHPLNSNIFTNVTELFQGKVMVHFPETTSAANHFFFPVHSGTANLHFAYQNVDFVLPIIVTNCTSGDCDPVLGSKSPFDRHYEFDTLLMQFADRNGVPPQLLKAQIAQESGFHPDAYRYEPLSIDFAQITAPDDGSGPFGKMAQSAFASWALAQSGNCAAITTPQGNNLDLNSQDAVARQRYSLALAPNGQPLCRVTNANQVTAARPINPADSLPSMENVFYANDNDANINDWERESLKANKQISTAQRFYDYQIDNPPFTAQTVIAASYGLHQLLYTTAVGMGYADQNGVGLLPRQLFDPTTSLDLGTEYLSKMFMKSDGLQENNYSDMPGLLAQFGPALRFYNSSVPRHNKPTVTSVQAECGMSSKKNKSGYACGILHNAPNYDPAPLPPTSGGGGGGGGGPTT